MKRLIVNADDFGLTESVNRGIILAHREGILTSASLLANGLAFDQAIALSRQLPRLSLGVHLNISGGKPVSSAGTIPTLLNERGQLHFSPLRVGFSLLTRGVSLEDIRSEFRAQLLKVLEAGVTPAHLDSHLHVHLLPQLAPIVIDLAREFHIRYVRCPAENLGATLPVLWKFAQPGLAALERSAVAFAVSSLAAPFRERLRKGGLVCSDAFYGLVHTGFLDAKALTALLHLVPEGTTELMCHPGFPGPKLESVGGKLTQSRETEVLALTARETQEELRALGIRLTNFRDFAESLAD